MAGPPQINIQTKRMVCTIKDSKQWMSILAGCMVMMAANFTFAQDWPQWRGPNRDAKVTGFTAPETWPEELTQKWKVTVGQGDSTPALVGDKLYVFTRQGGDEVILCLDAGTGEEVWRDKYAAVTVTGGSSREHFGPRSSPTVADGKVVTLGVGGILSCYDAATGDLKWRKDDFTGVWPVFFVAMSPIVVDGLCIAHLGGKNNGAIIAYDLDTGNQKWKWSGDGPTYASPVLMTVKGTEQLVLQTENNIVGITVADGQLLWQVAVPPQMRFYSSITPVIDGQTVIYTGQGRGTKAIKVEKKGDEFVTSELWSNNEIGTGYNTPLLKDGLLFGVSDPGNVIFCMNAQNGKTLWTDTKKYDRYGTIVDLGSIILALPASELIVIEPNEKEYKELARYKVSNSNVYAYSVVAGNRIFIKDQDSLTLWTID